MRNIIEHGNLSVAGQCAIYIAVAINKYTEILLIICLQFCSFYVHLSRVYALVSFVSEVRLKLRHTIIPRVLDA